MKLSSFVLATAACLIVALSLGCSKSTNSPSDPPPYVHAYWPMDGSEMIALDSAVSVTFSEDVNPASVTTASFWIDGKPGVVGCLGRTATLTPATPFDHNTAYTVHVKGTIQDGAGNAIGSDFAWSFTTREWGIVRLASQHIGAPDRIEVALAAAPAPGGHVFAAGWSSPSPGGNVDILLTELDSNGIALWERTLDLGAQDRAVSVLRAVDGSIALAGRTGDDHSTPSGFLVKTDASGNVQWQRTIGAATEVSVASSADGDLLVYGPGATPYMAEYTLAAGTQQWVAGPLPGLTMGGLCQATAGGYLYSSNTANTFDKYNLCVGRVDESGALVWFKELVTGSGLVGYFARGITALPNGTYVVFGAAWADSPRDGVAVAIDGTGNILWTFNPLQYGNRGYTGGLPFRNGVIAIMPEQSIGYAGFLVYLTAAGSPEGVYHTDAWRWAAQQQLWVYAGVPTDNDGILAVGTVDVDVNDAVPKQLLFLRLRYM